jgi:hypothetical protein
MVVKGQLSVSVGRISWQQFDRPHNRPLPIPDLTLFGISVNHRNAELLSGRTIALFGLSAASCPLQFVGSQKKETLVTPSQHWIPSKPWT